MKSLEIILPIIIGPIGVILGWLLSKIDQGLKSKKEDNRIRNQVLFNLLEIHHLLKSANTNISQIIELLIGELKRIIPEIGNDLESQRGFEQFFTPICAQFIKKQFVEDFSEVNTNYIKSIELLAPVDPIVAFKLSGSTSSIKSISDWVSTLIEGMKPHISNADQLDKDAAMIHQITETKVFASAINDIREQILTLSGKIHFLMRRKVSKLLEESDERKEIEAELKQMLKEMLEEMIKNFAPVPKLKTV